MIVEWCSILVTTLLAFLIYIGYFFKFNWIRDLRRQKKPIWNKIGDLPPVYPNGWFGLLESSELKRGEVKYVSALGENFAVFRTEEGIAKILDAYCPHLGANMAVDGRVKGDCLECPFHQWLFRGDDGHCTSIPYSQQKIPTLAKVRAWKSCEANQIIFVWYHAESADPAWELRDKEIIANGTFRYQGRNEFFINCHIQDIPENGSDEPHLQVVHTPGMFLSDKLMRYARHTWKNYDWEPYMNDSSNDPHNLEDGDSWESTKTSTTISTTGTINKTMVNAESKSLPNDKTAWDGKSSCNKEKHRARMHLRHSLLLFEKFEILVLNVTVELIGPAYLELLVETTFGNMIIFQTVTPVEPLVQRVCHYIYSPPILAPYTNIVFLGECIMFERDIAIWNNKKFVKRPILVREERRISTFRKWYSQFYTENSPTYRDAVKDLQW